MALATFWAAVGVTLWLTLAPAMPAPGSDKLHHVFAFAGLTILSWGAYPEASLLWRLCLMVGFGAVIEVLQGALPFGRSAELMDLVADAAGIALGGVLMTVGLSLNRQSSED